MAYTPYYNGGWQSGEEGGTPITPAALNHMEDGIAAADWLAKANGTTSNQLFGLVAPVSNSANQDYNGKRVMLMLRNDGFLMWNSTDGNAICQLNLPVPVTQGGHGGTTAAEARTNLGITPANIGAFGVNSLPSSVTDANDTSLFGVRFFQASACANLPSSGSSDYYFAVFMGTLQFAVRLGTSGASHFFTRYYTNNQWYAWTGAALS